MGLGDLVREHSQNMLSGAVIDSRYHRILGPGGEIITEKPRSGEGGTVDSSVHLLTVCSLAKSDVHLLTVMSTRYLQPLHACADVEQFLGKDSVTWDGGYVVWIVDCGCTLQHVFSRPDTFSPSSLFSRISTRCAYRPAQTS